jgi:hypothetical protein
MAVLVSIDPLYPTQADGKDIGANWAYAWYRGYDWCDSKPAEHRRLVNTETWSDMWQGIVELMGDDCEVLEIGFAYITRVLH